MAASQNVIKPDFQLTSSFSTYLYAIAKRKWLKELDRRRKSQKLKDGLKENPEPVFVYDPDDDQPLLHQIALSCLGEVDKRKTSKCQELLTTFYLEGLTIAEITDYLEFKNENNTTVQKSKCMGYLKDCFHEKFKMISHER